MDYAYYDGVITPFDEARIPLSDRSVFFGDGVYECMIGYGGAVYQWHEHIERLKVGIEFIKLGFKEYGLLENTVKKLISLSGYSRYTVYLQLSRKSERRIHAEANFSDFHLLITLTELSEFADREVSLITAEDVRYNLCNIKTLNLLPAVLASYEALTKSADECVFIRGGKVTECAHSNIFLIKKGTLITPPLSRRILPGITRRTLLDLASNMGIATLECEVDRNAIFEADEVLITSTTRLARRVAKIDGTPLKMSDGGLVRELSNALLSHFMEFCC